jgi:hypothetical protein
MMSTGAGITIEWLATLLVTTAFAPTATLSPIRTRPNIIAPGPMKTLSPILGAPILPRLLIPIVTP